MLAARQKGLLVTAGHLNMQLHPFASNELNDFIELKRIVCGMKCDIDFCIKYWQVGSYQLRGKMI